MSKNQKQLFCGSLPVICFKLVNITLPGVTSGLLTAQKSFNESNRQPSADTETHFCPCICACSLIKVARQNSIYRSIFEQVLLKIGFGDKTKHHMGFRNCSVCKLTYNNSKFVHTCPQFGTICDCSPISHS